MLTTTSCTSSHLSGSSGSSLGPNIDSFSSSYTTTDNEESPQQTQQRTARALQQKQKYQQRHKKVAVIETTKNKLNRIHSQQQINSYNKTTTTTTTGIKYKNKEDIESPNSTASSGNNSINRNNKIKQKTPAVATTTTIKEVNNCQSLNNVELEKEEAACEQELLATTNTSGMESNNNNNNNNNADTTDKINIENVRPKSCSTVQIPRCSKNQALRATNLMCTLQQTQQQQQQQNIIMTTKKRYMTNSLTRAQTIVGHVANNDATTTTTTTNADTTAITATTTTINSTTTTTTLSSTTTTTTTYAIIEREREREQGGDYLIEICGRYLNIYGHGALRFIDKQWNAAKANDVHTLNFSYINFNNITTMLGRIKTRFPHAENFVFRETNINCLGQLNALAELQGISTLHIDPEGNPITTKDLWRQYAIYRLSHWGLKQLNGLEVTDTQINEANSMYSGLSDLVLWSMPDTMLQPLLTRLRLDETCMASKLSPKIWLMRPENNALRLVVGKEALQWKKSNATAAAAAAAATTNQIILTNNQAATTTAFNINDISSSIQPVTTTTTTTTPTIITATTTTITTMSTFNTVGPITTIASTSQQQNLALTARERGKIHFNVMMENTCNAIEKLHKVEELWPSLLLDIVRNTLLDYSQLDVYIRALMNDLMK